MAEDEYNPQAFDDADHDRFDDGYQGDAYKERLVVLVDADVSMLEPVVYEDQTLPRLKWVMQVVSDMLMTRVRRSPRDEIAVIAYGTVERSEPADNLRPFDRVFEILRMDVPGAKAIKQLRDFDVDAFRARPGCGDVSSAAPGRAAEDLCSALFAAWDRLAHGSSSNNSSSGSSRFRSRVAKSVMVFTDRENALEGAGAAGAHLRQQLTIRARELGTLAASLELLPPAQLQRGFNYAPLWQQLLSEAAAAASDLEGAAAEEGEEAAALSAIEEGLDAFELKLMRLRGQISGERRPRPVSSCDWKIAPGLSIAVKIYSLVQVANRPHHVNLVATTGNVASTSSALISPQTGAILPAATHRVFIPPNPERFPEVVMTRLEERELRALRPAGLVLIGFKPVAALKPQHNLGVARFVYPCEANAPGSTAAFASLHRACLGCPEGRQIAVCSYVRYNGDAPRLVAMLPQEVVVELDADTGEELQLLGPGFHMIHLPFRDDMRHPERDPSLVAKVVGPDGAPPRATQEQVDAAAALIDALSLDADDEPFQSSLIRNPHLERHWQVVEDLALGAQEPQPLETLDDQTRPNLEWIDSHTAVLDAFKLAVFGSVDGPQQPVAAGTKRKADDEAQATVAEQYVQHDWAQMASTSDGEPGSLSKATIAVLKVYLKNHGLPLSGNKSELLARIRQHMGGDAVEQAKLE